MIPQAYMIRNDGKLFKGLEDPHFTTVHPLLNKPDGNSNEGDVIDGIIEYEKEINWYLKNSNQKDYLKELLNNIENNYDANSIIKFIEECRKEFIEARYGGSRQTYNNNKELYIRYYSTGYNGFSVIGNFVEKYKSNFSSITIEKYDNQEYTNPIEINNKKISHISIEDFLTLKGNPEIS